jgi:signal transduction histidine kinase
VGLWLTWAGVVTFVVAFGVWALHVLIDVPKSATPGWALGFVSFLVPGIAWSIEGVRKVAAPVLRTTVTVGGVAVMVLAVYLVVVVGLGDDPEGTEHRVVWLSMVAGGVAVALAGPVRSRLRDLTTSVTSIQRPSASAALENFGARMTRAVPMDELLLQLSETLHTTMGTLVAEIWTGEGGHLDRVISVPDRGSGRIVLEGPELDAVTGSRVNGTSWAAMWLPTLFDGLPDGAHVRAAPITHLGKLLGLIVVGRDAQDGTFTGDDDRLLADLARQVGLALHNVSLDSALQASLEELQVKNRLLEESRQRVVTAADESRRKIERDLHDGAQQQLAALAMRVQVARLQAHDPEALTEALDALGVLVQQATDELRELAHGIYPPLLRDQGLGAALRRAAVRSPLTASADIQTDRRFDPAVEAAVYFCCLEAIQNAGKYAGPDARLEVRLSEESGLLVFEVSDDGAGFDPSDVAESHGFVNMRDRVGAHGGEVTVSSASGGGTTVRGELPVPDRAD